MTIQLRRRDFLYRAVVLVAAAPLVSLGGCAIPEPRAFELGPEVSPPVGCLYLRQELGMAGGAC